MKRILTLLLTLALLLPACAPNTPELPTKPVDSVAPPSAALSDTVTPSPEAQDDDSLSGTLTISMFDGYKQIYTQYINMFKQAHPNVEIVINPKNYDLDYVNQTATEFMAGRGDDLVFVNGLPFENYASKGMFADLNEFIDSEPGMREDYYPATLKQYTIDGKLYALPHGASFKGYWGASQYSSELDTLYGDKITMNYREVIEAFEQIRTSSPSLMYPTNYFNIQEVETNEKTQFYSYTDKKVNYGDEFLSLVSEIEPYKTPPSGAIKGEYLFENFLTINTGPNLALLLPGVERRTFIAVGTNGEMSAWASAFDFAINENSQNKELAWEFLKFINSQDAYKKSGDTESLPVRHSLMDTCISFFYKNTDESFDALMKIAEEAMDSITYYDSSDALKNAAIQSVYEDYANGLITAEELAARLQDKLTIYVNQ